MHYNWGLIYLSRLFFQVSDDEDEDVFIQRHNLEVLKASVEAKDKQAHYKSLKQQTKQTPTGEDHFYDENTTDIDDIPIHENGNGRRNSRRRKRILTAEEEANLGILDIFLLFLWTFLGRMKYYHITNQIH